MGVRIRRADTAREFERVVDDMVTQGWRVTEQGQSSCLLRQNTWGTGVGHFLWFLLAGWWTLGLANLAYALVAHWTAPQTLVRFEAQATTESHTKDYVGWRPPA